MVWKEAIRPREVAGINYFTIYNHPGAQGSTLPRITVQGYPPTPGSIAMQNHLQALHDAVNLLQQSLTVQDPMQLVSSAYNLILERIAELNNVQHIPSQPEIGGVRLSPSQFGYMGRFALEPLVEASALVFQYSFELSQAQEFSPLNPAKWHPSPQQITVAISKIRRSIQLQHRPEYSIAAPRIYKKLASAPSEYSWTTKNRSYARWDAGLLDACHESRQVVYEYLRRERQRPVGYRVEERKFLGLQQNNGKQTIMRPREEGMDPSVVDNWADRSHDDSIVVARNGNAHLGFRVNIYSDLYRFEYERGNMTSSLDIEWHQLLPQPSFNMGMLWPANVGFEFHYSWNEDIPNFMSSMEMENEATPRGLVARFWLAFCERKVPAHVTLWLMNSRPSPDLVKLSHPLPPRKVFSDLQRSWVEVKADEVVYRGDNEVKSERRTAFRFKELLLRRGSDFRPVPSNDRIRVLVPLPPGCV